MSGYYGVFELLNKGNPLAEDKSERPVCSLYGLKDFIDGTDLPLSSGGCNPSPSSLFLNIDTPCIGSLLSIIGSSTSVV